MTCTKCGAEAKPNSRFCPHCGTELSLEVENNCQNCSQPLKPGSKFCHHCGHAVGETVAAGGAQATSTTAETVAFDQTSGRRRWAIALLPLIGIPILVGITFLLTQRHSNPPPVDTSSAAGPAQADPMGMASMEAVTRQLDSLKHAVEVNPQDTLALAHLAAMYEMAGKFDEAATFYSGYLAVVPENMAIRASLARAYFNAGKGKDGLRELKVVENHFRDILSASPGDIDARMSLASTYFDLGEKEKAAKELQAVLEFHPTYEYAMYNLAVIYHDLQQNDKASEWWHKTIETNPSGPLAQRARRGLEMLNP